jgi:hypothetical protein
MRFSHWCSSSVSWPPHTSPHPARNAVLLAPISTSSARRRIPDGSHRAVLRSTRNRPRKAMHHGAIALIDVEESAYLEGPTKPQTAQDGRRVASLPDHGSDLLANRWQTAVRGAPRIRQAGCWTRPGLLVCGGAPRRNRTGDPILTMEPPGTAVRNPVSPGHARPSAPKLSVLFRPSYAFTPVTARDGRLQDPSDVHLDLRLSDPRHSAHKPCMASHGRAVGRPAVARLALSGYVAAPLLRAPS